MQRSLLGIYWMERTVITMADRWTEKQLQAITARDTAVIVSAAAGSGKTSVLVERLLRQLSDTENKIPADRMIIVTFTNDAAAQMKQRLTAELSRLIEQNPNDLWLYRQQSLIQTAKISTIHSFCFDLIRDNIQSLDISSGFRILDDTEENIIKAKAISAVMEDYYIKKPEMMAVLSDFFCGARRDDSNLEKTVLSIYKFIMSIPFYEDWLAVQLNRFTDAFDPNTDIWAKDYLKDLREQYRSLAKKAEAALSLCQDIGAQKAAFIVQNELDAFNSLADNTLNRELDWDERIYGVGLVFDRISFPKYEDGSEEKIIADRIKAIRNNYKDKCKKIISENLFSMSDIIDDYIKHKEILSGVIQLVLSLCNEIQKIKTEKNAIGFSDAEQLAVKLLAFKDDSGKITKTPLAEELSEYYKVIMIDEFQDANNTQDLIFKLLSHNGTAEKSGDNLFAVGDIKQSIYRFRLANPKIFIDTLEKADRYEDGYKGKNAAVLLNKNFRSSKEVVGFVNYIFSQLMTREVGEIDYTDDEKLVQGAAFDDTDRTTEIIIVPSDLQEEEQHSDEAEENDSEEDNIIEASLEAKAVAEKIKSLAGVRTVFENGMTRPSEYRDFCILLRDRGRAASYIEELSKLGIKAYSEETAGYLSSREISVLINLLTVTDNPLQDIPLASVLMSPMFMVTADELAKIRLLSEDKSEPLYKAVLKCAGRTEDFPADTAQSYYPKAERFLEVIEKLRYCSASQSLEQLIRTAYDSTDFLSVVQIYKDGEQKKANLRLLLEYAKSYEENSAGGLSGFIRYIGNIFAQGDDFRRAGTVSSSDNVVSIKTIHKSKGLEFPFVFLCGTSKKFNFIDLNSRMQINFDYGIGFKIQDIKTLRRYNSFPQTVIRMHNKVNSVSEEMRLLYVALTRAKEQLFITLADNDYTRSRAAGFAQDIEAEGGITPFCAANALSMQDWLIMALLVHPDGEPVREMAECDYMTSAVTDTKLKFSLYEEKQTKSNSQQENVKALPDMKMLEQLKKNFSFKYDGRLSQLPAKLTVTEIAKKEQDDEIYLKRPGFISDSTGLSAAESGTAMHTFMQYADFARAEKDIAAEIIRLEQNGIITPAQAASLNHNTSRLKSFFAGSLYGRIKKSVKVRREHKFLVEISALMLDDDMGMEYNNTNGMLQGIADCIFEEPDGLVLIDYKTDRTNNAQSLINKYERQLRLYSIALGKILGKNVKEAYIYSFGLSKEIKI